MSDYPMLISNKLHSFRNFGLQTYIFFFNNDTFSIFIFHLVHIKRGFVLEWRVRKRIEREEKEKIKARKGRGYR